MFGIKYVLLTTACILIITSCSSETSNDQASLSNLVDTQQPDAVSEDSGTPSTANNNDSQPTDAIIPDNEMVDTGPDRPEDTNDTTDNVDAQPQITRISLGFNGQELNEDTGQFGGGSALTVASEDGRFIAFTTKATNVIDNIQGEFDNVYFCDSVTNEVTKVSVSVDGSQLNNSSTINDMTPDGRYIVFSTSATNVIEGGTRGATQLYRYDTVTRETLLLSQDNSAQQGNDTSVSGQISNNGNLVIYRTFADNITGNDASPDVVLLNITSMNSTSLNELTITPDSSGNSQESIAFFHMTSDGAKVLLGKANNSYSIYNINSGQSETEFTLAAGNSISLGDSPLSDNGQFIVFTRRVNDQTFIERFDVTTGVSVDVNSENGINSNPDINADGRFITYWNITTQNVYLVDVQTNETMLISQGLGGVMANGNSSSASFVRGDNFVLFSSTASNLVADDNNFKQDAFLYRLNP